MKTFLKTRSEIKLFSMLYLIAVITLLTIVSCFAEVNVRANHPRLPEFDNNNGLSSFTFKVYCHAVSGTLFDVQVNDLKLTDKVQVSIFDMSGRMIYDNSFEVSLDLPVQEIDLQSKVSTGVVIFRAIAANNIIMEKVLLNN